MGRSFSKRLRGSMAERFAGALAARSMDWMLGPYAGSPEMLETTVNFAVAAGTVAFAVAESYPSLFGLDGADAGKVAVGLGTAVATGSVSVFFSDMRQNDGAAQG